MEIYDAIVSGFKANIPENTEIEAYLQSLQKSVKSLRIAYRNSPVFVPYEKTDIQAAYLATYLPHYYQLIYKIFIEEVPDIFKNKKEVHLTFIGGGPGSEAYGALKYIFNNCVEAKDIYVTILDINASTWNYSHSIVQDNLVDAINNREVTVHWKSVQFDLISEINTKKVKSIIEKSNLLVIQNCLNEIATTNLPALKTNLKLLFEYLPGTSYLLMSDLTSGARPIIKALEKYLVDNFGPQFIKSTLSLPSSRSLISVHHKPSAIIAQNLLIGTDGLIPRKNLSYDYSILSKGIIEEPIDYAALGFNALYRPLDFKNLDANDYIHKKIFIGIDFGTSSTVISTAQLIEGKIKIKAIPIKQIDHLGSETHSPLIPTIISLVNIHGKRILVGEHAADYKPYLQYGVNCWHSFKQNLINLEEVTYPDSELRKHPNFRISNAKEGLIFFLTYIKREIFEYLKKSELPTDVEYSISVPAGFSSKEKMTLKACLIAAGIECEDTPFIEEPNAALINHLFEENIAIEVNSPKNIMVLDLGAGTVDVSIILIENSSEEFTSKLLSVVRLGTIGSNLIDELIAESILQKHGLTISESKKIELISLCEKLKIEICKNINTDKSVRFELPPKSISEENVVIQCDNSFKAIGILSVSISYSEFNDLIIQYWNGLSSKPGILTTIEKALIDAKLTTNSIDKIIVSGGGGRNPYIKNLVAKYFGSSKVIIPNKIQEQVSRGVALQSFVLNSFGKNIITPILSQDIYIKGANKVIKLFENGISIPSIDVDVYLDVETLPNKGYIEVSSGSNTLDCKFFLIPEGIRIDKLVFYIAPDQELKCDIVSQNAVKEAEMIFIKPPINLLNLK